jgi:hypothetical protein
MSTTTAPLADARIMLRRNLRLIRRNPVTIFNGTLMPVVIMFLFVYVLGNAFNVGQKVVEVMSPQRATSAVRRAVVTEVKALACKLLTQTEVSLARRRARGSGSLAGGIARCRRIRTGRFPRNI